MNDVIEFLKEIGLYAIAVFTLLKFVSGVMVALHLEVFDPKELARTFKTDVLKVVSYGALLMLIRFSEANEVAGIEPTAILAGGAVLTTSLAAGFYENLRILLGTLGVSTPAIKE